MPKLKNQDFKGIENVKNRKTVHLLEKNFRIWTKKMPLSVSMAPFTF